MSKSGQNANSSSNDDLLSYLSSASNRYRTPTNSKKPASTSSTTTSKFLSKYDDPVDAPEAPKKYESFYSPVVLTDNTSSKPRRPYLSTKTEPLLDLIKSLELDDEKPAKYNNFDQSLDDATAQELNAVLSQAESNLASQTAPPPIPANLQHQSSNVILTQVMLDLKSLFNVLVESKGKHHERFWGE